MQRLIPRNIQIFDPMACHEYLLTDLLHEVPRLWDFFTGGAKKGLLGVSVRLRKETLERINHVTLRGNLLLADVSHLTSGRWSQLQVLDLGHGTLTSMASAELCRGAWPCLRSLSLAQPLLPQPSCNEDALKDFKGKWPLLEHLSISSYKKLDIAQTVTLVAFEWPVMKILSIRVFNAAIPALLEGRWPQLKDLSIGISLGDDSFVHLARCKWSRLERLQLTHCQVSPWGMRHLTQAHFPQLKELSLVSFSFPEHPEECYALLAQGKWPQLTTLELNLMHATHECIARLVTGHWPLLQTLLLEDFSITDADVPALVAAAWPAIKNITVSGWFNKTSVVCLCMERWPKLECLRLRAQSRHTAYNMKELAKNNWPSLDLQLL